MPSPQRIRANRANARRSTGPRTKDGRLRARLNALKHGLAVPASAHPALQHDIDHLARALVGEAQHDSVVMVRARKVAEAAIKVQRARRARLELLRAWDASTSQPKAVETGDLVRGFKTVRKEFQALAQQESSKEKRRKLRVCESVAKRLGGVAVVFMALEKAHPAPQDDLERSSPSAGTTRTV
ncbi:hypothetical protein JKG68_20075 [Microvirga aerilata]|uniref:Uncharacterized protein n=1 Tax=Microvirga aerilata TaxID=670292 RepID=A0A937D0U3_9HYPH|nr:hypothetical protein [Microvirga aerilata]MBL0406261.1 hypothetical protein [Microvirga aerilata]